MEELPGLSVFARDASGAIYHTYSTYSRGLESLIGASGQHAGEDQLPRHGEFWRKGDWTRKSTRQHLAGRAFVDTAPRQTLEQDDTE